MANSRRQSTLGRIDYLQGELACEGFLDGWTALAMKKELSVLLGQTGIHQCPKCGRFIKKKEVCLKCQSNAR